MRRLEENATQPCISFQGLAYKKGALNYSRLHEINTPVFGDGDFVLLRES